MLRRDTRALYRLHRMEYIHTCDHGGTHDTAGDRFACAGHFDCAADNGSAGTGWIARHAGTGR